MRKESNPAASGSIMPLFMKRGSVHGLSLCLLIAKPRPSGDSDLVMTANLALPPGMSISASSTGFASSRGLPDSILSLVAHASASSCVGMRFVLHSSKSAWKIRTG